MSDLYIPAEIRKIHNNSYDGVHKEAKEAYYAVKNQTIENLTPKEIKDTNKKIHENTIHFINGCKARGITSSQGILNKSKFEKDIAVSTPEIYRECRNGIGIIRYLLNHRNRAYHTNRLPILLAIYIFLPVNLIFLKAVYAFL